MSRRRSRVNRKKRSEEFRNMLLMDVKELEMAAERCDKVDEKINDKGIIKTHNSHNEKLLQKKRDACIGETKEMRCGMKAVIIAYRKASDIDVRFEDGTVVQKKEYGNFIKGNIGHPGMRKINRCKETRIGESREMKCGKTAIITEYFNAENITIQFEDGEVVKNRTYYNFTKGNIGHPCRHNYKHTYRSHRLDHIGEKGVMNCGMSCEIIEWYNTDDITVKFENGQVREHTRYCKFKEGEIGHKKVEHKDLTLYDLKKMERIGEVQRMKNGMLATIIGYNSAMDITVEFEDGCVVEHKTYRNFKKREIGNPNTYI